MEKLKFQIKIDASKEKVWNTLTEDDTYRKWTLPFSQGSHFIGNWKEGTTMVFLNNENRGMYSHVNKNIPYELISVAHIGMYENGKEQPIDEETKKWTGSLEEYYLTEDGGITTLEVRVDSDEDFKDYYNTTFPKAFALLKEIAEK
ncbi:SRPBCC domain-containing protein [Flavobacterium sp. '19STA2R22 D10 B1']|uniref:SRPBCC domain-containing protein n=1 Tax=Flavobacterium aerium TaxID=3037261 RepID=UPI00278BD574|nr:SRPBCC domain-containing protein [Flavobacterium sp. '19STA2R22 D10 B1']